VFELIIVVFIITRFFAYIYMTCTYICPIDIFPSLSLRTFVSSALEKEF